MTQEPVSTGRLKVSAHDYVSSLLVALLILVGFVVLVLFLLWMARRAMAMNEPVKVELLDEPSGRGDHALGIARAMEEPGIDELAEVPEPQLADTLAAITTTVTLQQAALDELESTQDLIGSGSDLGDARDEGPGGEGDEDIIPRWRRWEIRYATQGKSTYARQLDFFGIELGALGGSREGIDYASGVSTAAANIRSGPGDREKRLFFSWKSGTLREYDRQLLAAAGIDTAGRIVAQFYPKAVENRLAILERDHSGGRPVAELRKTLFGVRAAGGNYEYFVIDQWYRPRP